MSYSDTSILRYQNTRCHKAEAKNINTHYSQTPQSHMILWMYRVALPAVLCFEVLENNYCLNVFNQLYRITTHCIQSALTTPNSPSWSSQLTLSITFRLITLTAVWTVSTLCCILLWRHAACSVSEWPVRRDGAIWWCNKLVAVQGYCTMTGGVEQWWKVEKIQRWVCFSEPLCARWMSRDAVQHWTWDCTVTSYSLTV